MTRLFLQTLTIVALWCSLGCLLADALACTAQWQCSSVTTDYNYANCVNGQCVCLTNQGFTGAATTTSRCGCASPNTVIWQNGQPYCINLPAATLQSVQTARNNHLIEQVKRVYTNLIHPTPVMIINGSVTLNDLFAPNAKGRVDPFGTFDERAALIEYYYAFVETPTGYVISVDFPSLFGVGNEVFVRVNILFQTTFYGLHFYENITQLGRYLFDPNSDLIISGDISTVNLGKAVAASTADHASFIAGICTELTVSPRTCPPNLDPAGYYANYDDCVNFLTDSIPFGTYDQGAANSVVCRRIHTTLTHFDPVTHCPHAGKTGGGKCVDSPYADYYLVSY